MLMVILRRVSLPMPPAYNVESEDATVFSAKILQNCQI
jgi:hypothetical protein